MILAILVMVLQTKIVYHVKQMDITSKKKQAYVSLVEMDISLKERIAKSVMIHVQSALKLV